MQVSLILPVTVLSSIQQGNEVFDLVRCVSDILFHTMFVKDNLKKIF